MEICKEEMCTGCSACMNICPKKAISMTSNALGKSIPKIDDNKCISCELCKRKCPIINKVKKNDVKKVFAAWSKETIDQQLCSSGGIATCFSRFILENNGVVFGATLENKKPQHISIKNKDELNKLRGSKYVQSEIGYSYSEVKQYLISGKKVLFVGTPCQIAGLKSFLGKDYENLILIDLICHGVPPFEYLKEHLDTLCKGWDNVTFRGKYDFKLTVYKNNQIKKQYNYLDDEYYKAFYEGLIFRDNCYKCEYACPQRCSDITIGDFWGLDKKSLKNEYDGRISVALINTNKGLELFYNASDMIYYEERNINEPFCEEQTNLIRPSSVHKDRNIFEYYYHKKTLIKLL